MGRGVKQCVYSPYMKPIPHPQVLASSQISSIDKLEVGVGGTCQEVSSGGGSGCVWSLEGGKAL